MQSYQPKAKLSRSRAELTDVFISPVSNRLLDYWRAVKGDRVRPRLRDIDLMAIYGIAAFVAIRDKVDDGREYFGRYWGTGLVRALGFDATNKLVGASITPESAQVMIQRFNLTLEQESPVRAFGVVETADSRVSRNYEVIWLGLDNDAGRPMHVIGAFDYSYQLTPAEIARLESNDGVSELVFPHAGAGR